MANVQDRADTDETQRERPHQEGVTARMTEELERRGLLAVLEQLPVGVHVAEAPSGRLVLENAAIRTICGESPRSERIEEYSADYAGHYPPNHPRAGEPLENDAWPLARALVTGTSVSDQLVEIRRGDGTCRLASISARPVLDEQGHVVGGVATSVDVTEQVLARQKVERLLAESEAARERVTAVLESIGDAFYAIDADFRFTYVNCHAEAQWGRRREDLIGKQLWSVFPRAVGSISDEMHKRVMAERQPMHYETVSSVVGHWIDVSLYPEANGGVACYFRDATARKQAEIEREHLLRDAELLRADAESARERTTRLQALTAALAGATTSDAVADAAIHHTMAAMNADGVVIARYSADGDWLEIVRALDMPDDVGDAWRRFPANAPVPLAEAARSKEPIYLSSRAEWEARYPHLLPELQATEHHANAVVPLVFGDRVLGVLGAAYKNPRTFDAEDRALALAVAQQCAQAFERAWLFEAEHAARRDAEAASHAKSEFLAVMSHELRTPLNAIGGYAELIEMGIRGPVSAQQREDLRRIQQSQRHLLGLINEVLNYAKLETGSVHYLMRDVLVRDAVASAEALVAPQARAKGLALEVAACPSDLAVRADDEKFRQILINLLSNAVKFTDGGGRIELSCEPSADRVEIVVRDTGIGIAPDQLERIFEPFVQVRADLTRTQEGTGLGLAISRDLALGMGGALTVESEMGRGSVFTLTLMRSA